MWNAIILIMNKAGALRRQLHTEHPLPCLLAEQENNFLGQVISITWSINDISSMVIEI